MTKRVDLRTAARPAQPAPEGKAPRLLRTFEPGELVTANNLTPLESALLVKAGWKPGDPIPTNLPQIVQQGQQLVREDAARQEQARQASHRPPAAGPVTDFDELPADKQEQIMAALAGAKQADQRAKTQRAAAVSPHDSVNAAFQEAALAAGLSPEALKPATRKPGTAAPTQAAPPPLPAPPPPPPPPPPAAPPAEEDDPPAPPPMTTGAATDRCQHCGWRRDVPEPSTQPAIEDRRDFLQALLGGIRYKKAYSFLGGQLRVVFRTLTTAEADMAFLQAAIDNSQTAGDDDAGGEARFMRTLTDYRLCLSIDSLTRPDGVEEMPSGLDDWQTDPPPKGQTKLRQILPYIYEHVLPIESARRVVGSQFFLFQRQVELMEAHILDSDFWTATEEPH